MKRKIHIVYLIVFLFFYFSCKENTKNNINGFRHIKDTIWFDVPKRIKAKDSVKITLHYFLKLDTLNSDSITDRYTMFLYTFQNISEEKITAVVRSRDEEKTNKLDLKGKMIKDSLNFYHKFNDSGIYYITGFVEDNFFLKKNSKSEDNKTRKIGTYINQKIIVEKS